MAYIRSPEVGMFISGAMAIVGVYASFKIIQDHWRRRQSWRLEKYPMPWGKQVLPMAVWLLASFVGLAMYVKDYCTQLAHGP
jgi:hypothetical protein